MSYTKFAKNTKVRVFGKAKHDNFIAKNLEGVILDKDDFYSEYYIFFKSINRKLWFDKKCLKILKK